jgi:predicted dehydrogenase
MKDAISRREFLGNAGGALAFTIIPRHVLGGLGYTAPSEKVNIAGVGVGGQGGADIDRITKAGGANIMALCDVDERHARRTFNRYPDAKRYRDYRKMLDKEKGIDGVVVGTPDHTHAIVSMAAIKMGKHVYCEKPLTHTVYEARKLAEAAREHKVATQMGNQGQASEGTRRVSEFIWDGAIGPVREVHSWTDRPNRGLFGVYWPQGVERPQDTPGVSSTLDWDIWLGPAPERAYHPAYHPFAWRGWWDFGTGALGDIGCHSLDPVFRALKLGHPLSVHASCSLVNKETYPLSSTVHYDFGARGDMPPVKLTWYDGGLKPRRPDEMDEGLQLPDTGTLYIGEKGKMLNGRLIPESRMREYKYPEKTIPRSPGHYKEWIDACKGGEPGGSNFDWAGPLAEAVLLGNVALRVELREKLSRTKLYWDGDKMEFTNMPEANQFLHYEYRQGWSL